MSPCAGMNPTEENAMVALVFPNPGDVEALMKKLSYRGHLLKGLLSHAHLHVVLQPSRGILLLLYRLAPFFLCLVVRVISHHRFQAGSLQQRLCSQTDEPANILYKKVKNPTNTLHTTPSWRTRSDTATFISKSQKT